jgi:hypothetical protein
MLAVLADFDYSLGAEIESHAVNEAIGIGVDQNKSAPVIAGASSPSRFTTYKANALRCSPRPAL